MKIIHKNKKAYFDYEILEEFTAGVMLMGPEVKSVRNSQVNLKGSYVSLNKEELYLKSAHISPYSFSKDEGYEPLRERKLLLKNREIEKIKKALNTQGITLAPLAIGLKGRYIKLLIALARGKKKHDKREGIKKREDKIKMDRIAKNYY